MKTDAAVVLAVVLLAAPGVRAEPPASTSIRPVSPLARLGTPATPEAVGAALEALDPEGEDAAAALAVLLGEAGGRAAAVGLARLAQHRSPVVRITALQAAGRLRIRLRELSRVARRSLRASTREERRAAVSALGGIGDGEDVPRLLAVAADPSLELQSAAYRALRHLTGLYIPNELHRWDYWWKTMQRRVETDLAPVLDEEIDSFDQVRPGERLALREMGWLERGDLEAVLRQWLVTYDRRLRCEACLLAAHHRLADLAPAIEEALRFAADEELQQAARGALGALGVPQPPERGPPPRPAAVHGNR